jgi:hypothetical protein
MKRISNAARAAAVGVAILAAGASSMVSAAPPVVVADAGAYVRLVGNPSDGTAKFQFGWEEDTPSSDPAGFWIGLYDVTNSHYEWSVDTEWSEDSEWVYVNKPTELGDSLFLNARPTSDLEDGDYKVVMFVRASYGPEVNVASIEVPFTVDASMG